MKKVIVSLVVLVGLSIVFTQTNRADEVDFLVSASIPAASGVNIVATKVDADTDEFLNAVSALNFDPMSFDSQLGIWLPDHYFAIDVGVTGGVGQTDVTVTYTEGDKPDDQVKGLGFKSTITFVKITGGPDPEDQIETELANHGPKQLLKDIADGEDIPATDISPGFFRAYVGIYPGDDGDLNTAGGEPFLNTDEPGTYDGTLTVSATLI